MTDPTHSGVPATPVSGDVPADEPGSTPVEAGSTVGWVAPPADAAGTTEEPVTAPGEPAPAAEPVAPPPAGAAEPAAPPEEPAPPAEPAEPVAPPEVPAPPAEPATPAEPVAPPAEPAPATQPITPPTAPVTPPAAPQPPPITPPTEPAPPATPRPVEPVPPTAPPTPAPPAEPATPAPATPVPATPSEPAAPTGTLDAGLAAAAATTTEVAPHAAVPSGAGSTDAPTGDEPADPDDPAGRDGGRRSFLLGLAAGLVALLVVGALAAFVGPVADARAERAADRRRADALAESRQLALNLVSIDYRTLDRDLQRISESTTGEARKEFDEKILQNESYKNLVRENQAVITSKIQRVGLEPCGSDDNACRRGDRAVVLVFLDQESRNKLRQAPRVDRNRVALTLVRTGNSWLVSEVKVI